MRKHVAHWNVGPGFAPHTEEEFKPLYEKMRCLLEEFGKAHGWEDDNVYHVVSDVWGDRTAKIEFFGEGPEKRVKRPFGEDTIRELQEALKNVNPMWRIVIGCHAHDHEWPFGIYIYPDKAEVVLGDPKGEMVIAEDMDVAKAIRMWKEAKGFLRQIGPG
jgi:hypothetical protein